MTDAEYLAQIASTTDPLELLALVYDAAQRNYFGDRYYRDFENALMAQMKKVLDA